MQEEYKQAVPIDLIKRSPHQPRLAFDEDKLSELAESIKQQGIVEPLILRPLPENHFELVCGERRWRAAMQAQLGEIPCVIRHYSDEQVRRIGLIENIQRENLNAIEEAQALEALLQDELLTQEELAAELGLSRSYIANKVALLRMAEFVQSAIRDGDLSAGHGKALFGLDCANQVALAQKAIKLGWNVRQLEAAARAQSGKERAKQPTRPDADTTAFVQSLEEKLAAPVQLKSTGNRRYELTITFYGLDEINGFYDKLP